MDSAFIQANTKAARAGGGNVAVDVQAMVAAGKVLIGGSIPFDFNSS